VSEDGFVIKIKNKRGTINISGNVFTILTGDAATKCFGVKGMALRSVSDGIVYLLRRESMGKGVHVIRNEDGTISIDLHIAVDRGVNIPVVCDSIIDEVRYKVSSSTGVEINRINVFVDTMMID
jgi:uncharacterized alkaline shock family protein YloU